MARSELLHEHESVVGVKLARRCRRRHDAEAEEGERLYKLLLCVYVAASRCRDEHARTAEAFVGALEYADETARSARVRFQNV